ncbi:hypothetical protein HOE04_00190 [archaeon]|nr:hypothetical protein [archaeon]
MDIQTIILIFAVTIIILGSLYLFFKIQKTLFKILLIIIAIILLAISYFSIINYF